MTQTGLKSWMDCHGILRGPRESLAKQRYWLGTQRRLARGEWRGDYWYELDGARVIPCRRCPKFDAHAAACSIPFGTPLRKCVVAATEAHLHGTRGLEVLEIGYGRRSFAKRVIEHSGGSWTGIEPETKRDAQARLGAGGYGQAGDIPFADATFDVVFGNQSFEHWEEGHALQGARPTYRQCLEEIWRVLKPGGFLYFDAPIHLHGHEMFIAGDVARIVGLFDPTLWRDVVTERWRYDHAPLPRYPTPAKDLACWEEAVKSYGPATLETIRADGTVWLLTVTATKRPPTE